MKRKRLTVMICLIVCSLFMQFLPHGVSATVNPTSIGLTEFALKASQNGWGYVYGTYGQIITQSMIDGKARQYPSVFSEIMSDGRTAYQHAQKWIGHRAADCVGLMKAYLWWQGDSAGPSYVSAQDKSANGLYYSSAVRGSIPAIPDIHGLLVWREGHIGVYIGNGEVIESRGVEYGVVKTRLTDRNWTAWCKHPSISYPTTGWVSITGKSSYYRDGQYVTGMQVIDGKTYFFGPDGFRLTGFQSVGGQFYYFTADGTLPTGWQSIEGSRYYLGTDGIARTGWQNIDGQSYLFSPLGIMLTGWQEQSGAAYYLNSNGNPLTSSQEIDNRQLTFSPSGQLLTGWQMQGDNWLYYDRFGQPVSGMQLIDGMAYWFDENGVRQTGWQTVSGKPRYFDPATGAGLASGLQTAENQPVLINTDSSLNQTAGLFFSSGQVYWSDSSGNPFQGQQTLLAYPAGASLLESGEPVSVNLLFAADYTLQLKNQDTFDLDQTSLNLLDLADPVQTGQLATVGQILPPEAVLTAKWLSLDPSVASVDASGLVSAVGPGRTLIIYLTSTGEYASSQVTVLPDPASLPQDDSPLVLQPGRSADLATDILPGNLLTACAFSSSAPDVVSVSPAGRLLAIKAGTASIQVSLGGQVLLNRQIQVEIPLLGLSAKRTALTIPVGAEAPAFASLFPASATTAAINFSSSDPAVASIEADGTIKGNASGSAVLKVQADNHELTCTIQVSGTYPTLQIGNSGENVRQLQQRLFDLGYITGLVDGQFGPITEFAVTSFQKKLQWPLTGEADHALQIALQSDQAPQATPLAVAETLSVGDSGEAVFVLQQRLYELNFLKGKPDGNFTALTLQAVQTLQACNGWTMSGNVNYLTIRRLYDESIKAGRTTLKLGDGGYEVLMLQTRLKTLKYYLGGLDSQFSAAVDQAVRSFQTQAGLTADGQAGPLTQSRLFAENAPMTPAIPVAPAVPATLRSGSKGAAVLNLEKRLVALGYHYAVANDAYDALTVSSIKAFQRRAGLSQTGVADIRTQNRLNASTAPRSTTTFRIGSRGDAVRRIQQRLNQLGFSCGYADGRFGRATDRAARAFQRKAGLAADGILGSKTLARLFDASAPRAR